MVTYGEPVLSFLPRNRDVPHTKSMAKITVVNRSRLLWQTIEQKDFEEKKTSR